MRTQLPAGKTVRVSDPYKDLEVFLNGELVDLVEEAYLGKRGYAVVYRRDELGRVVSSNGRPVYKVVRGDVTAFYDKVEETEEEARIRRRKEARDELG